MGRSMCQNYNSVGDTQLSQPAQVYHQARHNYFYEIHHTAFFLLSDADGLDRLCESKNIT